MMKKNKLNYLYIMNSTKPSKDEYESTEDIAINSFCRQSILAANQMGYDIVLGINKKYPDKIKCSDLDLKFYNSNTYRNIFSFKDNFIAYKELTNTIKKQKIDIIHCNTPIGGVLGRICGRKCHVNKIIYMVHGFHFYNGGNKILNCVYKSVETFFAKWTDVLITINEEDYIAAKKMKLRSGGKVYKVHGVGIELNNYINTSTIDYDNYRESLGISKNDFLVVGTGRLDKNKNFEMAIKSVYLSNNKSIKLFICGVGEQNDSLKELVHKLGIDKQVHFLGFRNDVSNILEVADCFISTSKREVLSRSVMEGMRAGLPCIVSNIRGNRDLIDNNQGGFLIENEHEGAVSLNLLLKDDELRRNMKKYNLEKIKDFSNEQVYYEMLNIYSKL